MFFLRSRQARGWAEKNEEQKAEGSLYRLAPHQIGFAMEGRGAKKYYKMTTTLPQEDHCAMVTGSAPI